MRVPMSEYSDFIKDIHDSNKEVHIEVGGSFYLARISILVGDYAIVDVNYNGKVLRIHCHALSLRCVEFAGH
jgi:hypothetical protein